MNILIFAGYYHPYIGGYAKNIHELTKRLAMEGHIVEVVTCNTENAIDDELIDGVYVHRLKSVHLLGNTFPVPIDMPYCNNKPDIIVTQTRFFPICLLGLLYAKINKLPLIHVERGTCHSIVASKIVNLIAKSYDHTIGSLIAKSAKANVGISNSACEFVKHLGGNNRRVIYNGIDITNNRYRDMPLSNIVKIVFVGRLIYAKGVQDLIVAFEACCKSFGSLRLIIIGDGNYRKELEKLANKSKFCQRIQFLGEIEHDKILDILSVCDIFINPSYSEGLPTSVIEAASIGLPVIATDVGGTNEIIEHGKTGLLVKPYDISMLASNLIQVIMRLSDYKVMGDTARQVAEQKFNWNMITNQWVDLLNEVKEEHE